MCLALAPPPDGYRAVHDTLASSSQTGLHIPRHYCVQKLSCGLAPGPCMGMGPSLAEPQDVLRGCASVLPSQRSHGRLVTCQCQGDALHTELFLPVSPAGWGEGPFCPCSLAVDWGWEDGDALRGLELEEIPVGLAGGDAFWTLPRRGLWPVRRPARCPQCPGQAACLRLRCCALVFLSLWRLCSVVRPGLRGRVPTWGLPTAAVECHTQKGRKVTFLQPQVLVRGILMHRRASRTRVHACNSTRGAWGSLSDSSLIHVWGSERLSGSQ